MLTFLFIWLLLGLIAMAIVEINNDEVYPDKLLWLNVTIIIGLGLISFIATISTILNKE